MFPGGLTALHYAAADNGVESTSLLLERGYANINAVTLFMQRTRLVSISTAGQTLLHVACARNPPATQCIKLLIEKGADVNVVDETGNKPLLH